MHQGLAARIPTYEYAHPDDLLDRAAEMGEPPLIVALDSVTDPRNLGAVVRSAAGFGAHGVLIPERRAAGMTAAAWKTSAGAAARIPVAQAVNLVRQLKAYQDAGCMVIGLAADGDVSLPDLDLGDGPLVRRRRRRGQRAVPPRHRDLRPDRLHPDVGQSRVAQRRRGGQRRPVRGLAVAGLATASAPGRAETVAPATWRGIATTAVLVLVWALVSMAAGLAIFLGSSRTLVLATHDAELRPSLDGYVVLHTGPVLPDIRQLSGGRIGVDITLGKTDATSVDELLERYAYIGSQPEGQIAKVRSALGEMVVAAGVRGALVGLVPIALWFVLGRRRRLELLHHVRKLRLLEIGLGLLLAGVLWWQPWDDDDATVAQQQDWMALGEFLGPEVPLPEEVQDLEVLGDVTTDQTRRLIASAISTYDQSKTFYDTAALAAEGLELRQPSEDETVVLLIADRHDNIGMDEVARAVGDAGGATVVFDAGDDTSAGKTWEAFSLDSVNSAFDDLDRVGVAGNHDHGPFVSGYLADRGWTMLDGEVINGPDDIRLLGVDDPRSSGLGNWRDETGLSFEEVGSRLSDVACASADRGRRVATMLVHDANLARRSAGPRMRRPRRRRPHPRAGRADQGGRRGRCDRLHLHDRDDRRGSVRHRHRQQAPSTRRHLADHLPGGASGGHPVRHPPDHGRLRRRRLRRPITGGTARRQRVSAAT